MTTSHDPLTDIQTAMLLECGLSANARPIDQIVRFLGEKENRSWLEGALRMRFADNELALLLHGSGDEAELIALKARIKHLANFAASDGETIVALAGYCFSVASGLAHFGKLMSSRPPAEWAEHFASLLGVAPHAWRELLQCAAERALELDDA